MKGTKAVSPQMECNENSTSFLFHFCQDTKLNIITRKTQCIYLCAQPPLQKTSFLAKPSHMLSPSLVSQNPCFFQAKMDFLSTISSYYYLREKKIFGCIMRLAGSQFPNQGLAWAPSVKTPSPNHWTPGDSQLRKFYFQFCKIFLLTDRQMFIVETLQNLESTIQDELLHFSV